MKRAFRTTWNGITSIVAADSVSGARYRTQRSAGNVDWKADWCDIRVVRAPEYDDWAAVDSSGCCWDEANLPKAEKTAT